MENRACHRYIYIMLTASLLINSTRSWSQNAPRFRPVPTSVVELTGFGRDGGIVALKDESLMLAQGGGSMSNPQKSLIT